MRPLPAVRGRVLQTETHAKKTSFYAGFDRPVQTDGILVLIIDMGNSLSAAVLEEKPAARRKRGFFVVETTLTEGLTAAREKQVELAARRPYWKLKRVLDIVISLGLILILAPLLLLIAVCVYIDDPHGSPIFSQVRVGLRGKEFVMYKFRTMITDAEAQREALLERNEMDGPVFKIERDPRITRLGRFLRRCSLDELPQLFNVLLGDMSMIGPRPPLPGEVAEYTDYQRLRLSVKPGLSCNWQVCKQRNAMSFAQWVEMDLDYILQASLWTDIKLFVKTPLVMLLGEGC